MIRFNSRAYHGAQIEFYPFGTTVRMTYHQLPLAVDFETIKDESIAFCKEIVEQDSQFQNIALARQVLTMLGES